MPRRTLSKTLSNGGSITINHETIGERNLQATLFNRVLDYAKKNGYVVSQTGTDGKVYEVQSDKYGSTIKTAELRTYCALVVLCPHFAGVTDINGLTFVLPSIGDPDEEQYEAFNQLLDIEADLLEEIQATIARANRSLVEDFALPPELLTDEEKNDPNLESGASNTKQD